MPISLEELQKKGEVKIVSPQVKKSSWGSKIIGGLQSVGNFVGELNKGLVKNVASTALSTGKIGSNLMTRLPGGGGQEQVNRTNELVDTIKPSLETSNISQKIGGIAGEIAQYMTPVGAEKASVKIVTTLDKVLSQYPKLSGASKLLSKSGILGTEFAGKTALMTGDKEQSKQAGIIGAATPPALKTIGKVGKFTFGEVIPSVLSSMTGIAPDTIKSAFKNPVETAKFMAGKIIPVDVREKAVAALDKYRTRVGETFDNGLKNLKTENKTGISFYPDTQLAKQVYDEVKGIPSIFRKFSVGVKKGILDFSQSNIVKTSEQNNLQAVFDTIKNQKDFSVQGVQRVAARINALSKFTDGVQNVSSAVISQIHNTYAKAIEKSFPKLGTLRAEYAKDMEIIKGIDSILKSAKNDIADPGAVTTVAKKLVNLFNEDNEAYVRALKRLEDETGTDLINQFVAANFDKIMPGKLGSYMMQAGLIAGGIVYNPMIIAVLPLFSPKVAGKILTGTGKAIKALEPLGKLLPSRIK